MSLQHHVYVGLMPVTFENSFGPVCFNSGKRLKTCLFTKSLHKSMSIGKLEILWPVIPLPPKKLLKVVTVSVHKLHDHNVNCGEMACRKYGLTKVCCTCLGRSLGIVQFGSLPKANNVPSTPVTHK